MLCSVGLLGTQVVTRGVFSLSRALHGRGWLLAEALPSQQPGEGLAIGKKQWFFCF